MEYHPARWPTPESDVRIRVNHVVEHRPGRFERLSTQPVTMLGSLHMPIARLTKPPNPHPISPTPQAG